jgi:hypothetical protein
MKKVFLLTVLALCFSMSIFASTNGGEKKEVVKPDQTTTALNLISTTSFLKTSKFVVEREGVLCSVTETTGYWPWQTQKTTNYTVYRNPYNDTYYYIITVVTSGVITQSEIVLGTGRQGEISAQGTCGMISDDED